MTEVEEAIRAGFLSQMNDIFTALPCVVLSISGVANQTVDVQPCLLRKFKDNTTEEYPPILGVPLVYPASSKSSFTFPISVGDTVLCVFSQRGLDTFKAGSGGMVEPSDYRKFSKRDAIAIPGLFPFSKSVNSQSNRSLPHSVNDAVVAHNLGTGNEVEVRLKADGGMLIKSPKTITVECKDAVVTAQVSTTITSPDTTWTGNIVYTGNITINGNLVQNGVYTLDGVNMNSHVHSGVSSGPSKTSVPE